MNDTDRLKTANSSPYSGSAPTLVGNANTRRASPLHALPGLHASSGLQLSPGIRFSSGTSGLVDVFAQVFAQMTKPIPAPPPKVVPTTDPAPKRKDTTAASSEPVKHSDSDKKRATDDADQGSNNARDAVILATATTSPRPQPEPKKSTDDAATATDTALVATNQNRQPSLAAKKSANNPTSELAHPAAPKPTADLPIQNGLHTQAAPHALAPSQPANANPAAPNPAATAVKPTPTPAAAAVKPTPITPASGAQPPSDQTNSDQTNSDQTNSDQTNSAEKATVDPSALADAQSSAAGNDGHDGDSPGSEHHGKENDAGPLEPRAVQSPIPNPIAANPGSQDSATSTSAAITPSAVIGPSSTPVPVVDTAMKAFKATTAIAAAAGTSSRAASSAPSNASSSTTSASASDPSGIQSTSPSSAARSTTSPKPGGAKSNSANDAVTRAKLVQRVSKAFQHLGVDGGTIRLRLAPAELGSVRVEMQIQGRKVNARVVAETDAASSMLRDHLHDLRSRLEAHGMKVERIEVETDENSFNPSHDSQQQGYQGNEQGYQGYGSDQPANGRTVSVKRPVSQTITPRVPVHAAAMMSSGVDIQF